MARPNLSVNGTSLVGRRWSLANSKTGTEGTRRRARAREHFLSNGLSRSREAQAFPPEPLGDRVARALLPANSLHRRNDQGMPEGRGGRKLNIIINAGIELMG